MGTRGWWRDAMHPPGTADREQQEQIGLVLVLLLITAVVIPCASSFG